MRYLILITAILITGCQATHKYTPPFTPTHCEEDTNSRECQRYDVLNAMAELRHAKLNNTQIFANYTFVHDTDTQQVIATSETGLTTVKWRKHGYSGMYTVNGRTVSEYNIHGQLNRLGSNMDDVTFTKLKSHVAIMEKYISNSWVSKIYKDEMTGEIDHIATAISGEFGLQCDNGRVLRLTFDTGETIATPGSEVSIMVKVDDNTPLKLKAFMYTNSYKGGTAALSSNSIYMPVIIKQMKSGRKALVRITTARARSIVNMDFGLNGFTKHTAQAIRECS